MKWFREPWSWLVFLVITIALVVANRSWNEHRIHDWANDHKYNVVEWHRPYWFERTPFFRRKGDDIFYATLRRDGRDRKCYFRASWFGLDHYWEDRANED